MLQSVTQVSAPYRPIKCFNLTVKQCNGGFYVNDFGLLFVALLYFYLTWLKIKLLACLLGDIESVPPLGTETREQGQLHPYVAYITF